MKVQQMKRDQEDIAQQCAEEREKQIALASPKGNMAASNARLKYRIPDFPVSELLAHSQQTKGWQTARYCDFPQEVCLQFESPVHLRQVQFLSHQSKIATKIELFTGLTPASGPCQLEAVQFKRLGYLSLDNNERSQFQARELKSVYVDVVAQFLRIVFHKCHVNRYNALNQVGLIALSCLGEAGSANSFSFSNLNTSPVEPAVPPAAPAAPAASAAAPAVPVSVPAALMASPSPSKAQILLAEKHSPATAPSAEILEPPPPAPVSIQPPISKVASDLADLDEAKYDVKTLERLKSLLVEKQKCVEAEETEYDVAKSLKSEIDRLRHQCEGVEEKESKEPPPLSAPLVVEKTPGPRRSQRTSYPKAARPAIPPSEDEPEDVQAKLPLQPSRSARSVGGYRAAPEAPPVVSQEMPVTPSVGSTAKPKSSWPQNGVRGDGFKSDFNGKPPQEAFAEAHYSSNGTPNQEELGQPEPIPPNLMSQAEPLFSVFGSHLIQCVFSKSWSRPDIDPPVSAYIAILMRTIPDKNVQVFHSSAALLQALCSTSGACLEINDLQGALEPLLPLLAERLGDANARAEKTARDAHLDLARCVGAAFAAQHLLRPPKKKPNRLA
eukprot:g1900.t1